MRNRPQGKYLSASRMKTMDSCHWAYWCQYCLKVPQPPAEALQLGSVCHELLEKLQFAKNKKEYDSIVANKTVEASKMAEKHLLSGIKDNEALDDDHYPLMQKMILVALNEDFFIKDSSELLDPEYEFDLNGEVDDFTDKKRNYRIYGLMDKLAIFKKDNKIEIHDYKTSKKKFSGDDLEASTQAMMYSLAARKLWPELKPIVKFIFLRFPKKPIQEIEFSDEALKGFEDYLEWYYEKMLNFNEEDAVSKFARDIPKPADGGWGGCLNCGFDFEEGALKKDGTKMWGCSYKWGRTYYAIKNSKGEVVKTSLKQKDLKPKKGEKLVKMTYKGCPKWS